MQMGNPIAVVLFNCKRKILMERINILSEEDYQSVH